MLTENLHDYQVFGAPLIQRIDEIKKKSNDSNRFFGLDFMGKYRDLSTIEVKIDFPVYRLKNGRTRTFQREYLATHPDKPKDIFTSEHDSLAAQSAQHEILYKLVEEEDLLKNFKNENLYQTEPIICTDTGVVVNGNRRLCAWREIYYSNKEKFKHFQTITIAILPPCDESDIDELEKKLQIQNSMRAEYHWHTIALMAREEIENGGKRDSIAHSFGKSPQALQLLMDARDYAEQYLISIDKPEQWSLVDKSYYAFEQMVKGRKKLQDQGEKELFESLAFSFITSGGSEGRLYETIPDIVDNIKEIAEELAPRIVAEEEELQEEDDAENLLSGGEQIEVSQASKVAAAVRQTEDVGIIQNTTKSVIEVQKQLKNEKKAENFLVLKLSKAVSELQNAITNGLNDCNVNTEGVEKQLNAISEKVEYIQKWLDERNED
ncbi:hypothetical protein ACPWSR_13130 [Alloiococcus sp. CFN-8]|uniref:hypothetical protein n=1 Tax=Alloiococcus sp. CFN-8 TaxID=3416081 RepID=UPI003CF7044B